MIKIEPLRAIGCAVLLAAATGANARATIAQEMVRRFLGREPSNKAFLAEITGRR